MKKLMLLSVSSLCALFVQAQNAQDALRFARTMPSAGTARALGMAGAGSAMGADLSAATLNPAGLALFRKSTFTFSPALHFSSVNSGYADSSMVNNSSAMKLSNWGFAFVNNDCDCKGLKSWTFAFGQNQLADFSRNVYSAGNNTNSSITDYFAHEAKGQKPSSLNVADPSTIAQLAYYTYAIYPTAEDSTRYFGSAQAGFDNTPNTDYPNGRMRTIRQAMSQEERGRINEWFVSFAGNYQNFLYFGGTLGIDVLRYERNFTVLETDPTGNIRYFENRVNNPDKYPLETPFKSLEYKEYVKTTGTGVNAKFGLILAPTDFLRIGGSIQTPTAYTLTDNYSYSISQDLSKYAGGLDPVSGKPLFDKNPSASFTGTYQYRYSSPYRMTAGAMLLLGKIGFVNVDVEMLDYASTKFSAQTFNDRYFDATNTFMSTNFQQAYNYRIGGELRLDKVRLRAGYGLYGATLKANQLTYKLPDGSTKTLLGESQYISGGIGYRKDNFFMDWGLLVNIQQDGYAPYNNAYNAQTDGYKFVPTVANTWTRVMSTFTIGFTFGGRETPSYSVGGMTPNRNMRGDMVLQP